MTSCEDISKFREEQRIEEDPDLFTEEDWIQNFKKGNEKHGYSSFCLHLLEFNHGQKDYFINCQQKYPTLQVKYQVFLNFKIVENRVETSRWKYRYAISSRISQLS